MKKIILNVSLILLVLFTWSNCCIFIHASENKPEYCKVEIIEENEWTIQD